MATYLPASYYTQAPIKQHTWMFSFYTWTEETRHRNRRIRGTGVTVEEAWMDICLALQRKHPGIFIDKVTFKLIEGES